MREPTEMELRVAKAISGIVGPGWGQMYQNKREWIDDRGQRQPDVNGPFKDDCLEAARAAIRAMREPTEEMFVRGDEAIIEVLMPIRPPLEPTPAQACWPAMIDAASPEE